MSCIFELRFLREKRRHFADISAVYKNIICHKDTTRFIEHFCFKWPASKTKILCTHDDAEKWASHTNGSSTESDCKFFY